MKTSIISTSLLSLIGLSSAGYSQVTMTQNVTVALVETYTAPALPAKNESGVVIRGADPVSRNEFSVTSSRGVTTSTIEEGTKMVTVRIGNKEMLQDLVDEGVIPSITGYSIQQIGTADEEGYFDGKFYVVKRGETPIDISEHLYVKSDVDDSEDTEAEAYSYREVTVDQPERVTITAKANGKELISLVYESSSSILEMTGVANWAETYRKVGIAPNQVGVWAPGAASITGISGSLEVLSDDDAEISTMEDESSDDEPDSVLEGRFSVSASVITVTP
jgi:hypothetical protein